MSVLTKGKNGIHQVSGEHGNQVAGEHGNKASINIKPGFEGKSFAEILKKDKEMIVAGEGNVKEEVFKPFYYNSSLEETSRFAKAMVGDC